MAKETDPYAEEPSAWCARTFHICVIVVFLAVLVLSLVSLGSFVTKHNQIAGDACSECGSCILYASVDSSADSQDIRRIKLSTGAACAFAIWGEGVVGVIVLLLGLMALVKICIKTKVVSCLAVFDLTSVSVALLLGFVVGIIISTGLKQTCDTFERSELSQTNVTCDQQVYPLNGNRFYPEINTAQVTAWIGTGVLGFITVLYILIVVIYCCRSKSYKDDLDELPPFQPKSSRVSKSNTSSSSIREGSEDKAAKA